MGDIRTGTGDLTLSRDLLLKMREAAKDGKIDEKEKAELKELASEGGKVTAEEATALDSLGVWDQNKTDNSTIQENIESLQKLESHTADASDVDFAKLKLLTIEKSGSIKGLKRVTNGIRIEAVSNGKTIEQNLDALNAAQKTSLMNLGKNLYNEADKKAILANLTAQGNAEYSFDNLKTSVVPKIKQELLAVDAKAALEAEGVDSSADGFADKLAAKILTMTPIADSDPRIAERVPDKVNQLLIDKFKGENLEVLKKTLTQMRYKLPADFDPAKLDANFFKENSGFLGMGKIDTPEKLQRELLNMTTKMVENKAEAGFQDLCQQVSSGQQTGKTPFLDMEMFKGCSPELMRAVVDCKANEMSINDLTWMQQNITKDVQSQKFKTPATLEELTKQQENLGAAALKNIGTMVSGGQNFIAELKNLKEQAKTNPELQKQYDAFMAKFDASEIERMESELTKLDSIVKAGGPLDAKTAQLVNQTMTRMQMMYQMSDLEDQAIALSDKGSLEKEIADLEGQLAKASETDKPGLQTKLDKAKVDLQGLKITPGFEKLAGAYNSFYWGNGDNLSGADNAIRKVLEFQQRTQDELGTIGAEIDKALKNDNLSPEMKATLTTQKEAIADAKACLAAGKVISFRAQDVMTDDQFTLISSLEPSPPSDKAIKELLKCDDTTATMFAAEYKKSLDKEKAFPNVLKTLDKVSSSRAVNEFYQSSSNWFNTAATFMSPLLFSPVSAIMGTASLMTGYALPPLTLGASTGFNPALSVGISPDATVKPDLSVDVTKQLFEVNQETMIADQKTTIANKIALESDPKIKATLAKNMATAQEMLDDPAVPSDVKLFISQMLSSSATGNNLDALMKFTFLASTYRENTNKGLKTSEFASLLTAGTKALQGTAPVDESGNLKTGTDGNALSVPEAFMMAITEAGTNDQGFRLAQAREVAEKLLKDPYISAASKKYLEACLKGDATDTQKGDLIYLTELFTLENSTSTKQHTAVNQSIAILSKDTTARGPLPNSAVAPYQTCEDNMNKVRNTTEYKNGKLQVEAKRKQGVELSDIEQATQSINAADMTEKLQETTNELKTEIADKIGKETTINKKLTDALLKSPLKEQFGYDPAKYDSVESFLLTLTPERTTELLAMLKPQHTGDGTPDAGGKKEGEGANGTTPAGDANALNQGEFSILEKILTEPKFVKAQQTRVDTVETVTKQQDDLKKTVAGIEQQMAKLDPSSPRYKILQEQLNVANAAIADIQTVLDCVKTGKPVPEGLSDKISSNAMVTGALAAIFSEPVNEARIEKFLDLATQKGDSLSDQDFAQFLKDNFTEPAVGPDGKPILGPDLKPLTKGEQIINEAAKAGASIDFYSLTTTSATDEVADATGGNSGGGGTVRTNSVVTEDDSNVSGTQASADADTPVDNSGGNSEITMESLIDRHKKKLEESTTPLNAPIFQMVNTMVQTYRNATPDERKELRADFSSFNSALSQTYSSMGTSLNLLGNDMNGVSQMFTPDFIKKLQAENDKQDVNDFKAEQAAAEEMGAVIDEKTSAKIKAANDLAQSLDLTAVVGGKDAGDLAAEFAKIIGEADFAQRQILLKALAKKLVDAFINKKYKDKLDKANKEQMEALQKIAARMQQSTQILLESSLKAAIASSSDPKQQAVAASSMFKTHMGATGLQ